MPQPLVSRHGVFYFRQTVPEALRAAFGRREFRVSCRSKDWAVAKPRFAAAALQFELMLKAARQGSTRLDGRQVEALVGTHYRAITQPAVANKLTPEQWEDEALGLPAFGSELAQMDRKVDELLAAEGVTVDAETRARLQKRLTVRLSQAYSRNASEAAGAFLPPDPVLAELPEWRHPEGSGATADTSILGWFDKWAAEWKPTEKTRLCWRPCVEKFTKFIEHDIITAVKRGDVLRWKDKLVAQGLSANTINMHYLGSIRRTYSHWRANWPDESVTDPTAKVRVAGGRMGKDPKRAYTDEEAEKILRWARGQKNPFYRFAPLLQAYTGARVGEIVQLRVADVRVIQGITTVRFDNAGGRRVKNKNSIRTVPLCQHVLAEGFMDYVASLPADSFLFPKAAVADVRKTIGGKAKELLAAKIRSELKLTDRLLQPNHSWRHRLKDLCRNHGIPHEAAQVLQGWAPRSVADSYGDGFAIQTLAKHLERLPCQCP